MTIGTDDVIKIPIFMQQKMWELATDCRWARTMEYQWEKNLAKLKGTKMEIHWVDN